MLLYVLFAVFGMVHTRNGEYGPITTDSVYWDGYCRPLLTLQNGWYIVSNIDESSIYFGCKRGYASSVPDLAEIHFYCLFDHVNGGYTIRAAQALVNNGPLYVNNVTCEARARCKERPPAPGNHMEKINKKRYQLVVNHNGELLKRDYYAGDDMEYQCKYGYIPKVVNKESTDDYYGDYKYETNEAEEIEKPDTELVCGRDGKWNNGANINVGECEPITCDAWRFEDMPFGSNITNYKPIYKFLEKMKLECAPGFAPVDGQKSALCLRTTSFDSVELPKFECEQIMCPRVPRPLFGDVSPRGKVAVGETIEFYCDSGYRMIGKSNWTCQEKGKWDSSCVICTKEDMYCQPPCIPPNAEVFNNEKTLSFGSSILFTCKTGTKYSGSENRTCMRNRLWSGEPLDCVGVSLFNPNEGYELANALGNIPFDNETLFDDNMTDMALGRSIDVSQPNGVDVYIVQDVSSSISDEGFEDSNKFIKALLPKLGINSEDYGTRLALMYFASRKSVTFNQHYGVRTEDMFQSYEEAQATIDGQDIATIREETETGTDIKRILDSVKTDIDTKRFRNDNRNAQQVIILISDGMYTQSGNPINLTKTLKSDYEVEIYSIYVGDLKAVSSTLGVETMKELASSIEGERHFFKVAKEDINTILDEMINDPGALPCGGTLPALTNIKASKAEDVATKNAWPWMAQFFKDDTSFCGGTLIDQEWVLTAAHCFITRDAEEMNNPANVEYKTCLNKLVLKQLYRTPNERENDKILKYDIPGPCENDNDYKNEIFIHEKYNPADDPSKDYDIALVKLNKPAAYDANLKPICLWDDTLKESTGLDYENDILQPGKYGVVTGWGKRCMDSRDPNCKPLDTMKQIQMKIQPRDTCTQGLNDEQQKEVALDVMFCAGDKVDGKNIDACSGDSGGPFMVPIPNKENHFIQIGIVSFGFGCKQDNKYGFYTKLTPELLQWIETTKKNN